MLMFSKVQALLFLQGRLQVAHAAEQIGPILGTAGLTLSVDDICASYLAIADRLRGQIGEVSVAIQDAIDRDV